MERLRRPEPPSGTAEQQVAQLRRYLITLADEMERELQALHRKQKELEIRLREEKK